MSSLAIAKNDVTFSKTRSIVTDRVTAKYAFSLAFWQMLRCYATVVESSRLLGGVGGVGGGTDSHC
jgi:hypothetical protein